MPNSQLTDEKTSQENDAEREVREITERIARISTLIENQIKFETKRAK